MIKHWQQQRCCCPRSLRSLLEPGSASHANCALLRLSHRLPAHCPCPRACRRPRRLSRRRRRRTSTCLCPRGRGEGSWRSPHATLPLPGGCTPTWRLWKRRHPLGAASPILVRPAQPLQLCSCNMHPACRADGEIPCGASIAGTARCSASTQALLSAAAHFRRPICQGRPKRNHGDACRYCRAYLVEHLLAGASGA